MGPRVFAIPLVLASVTVLYPRLSSQSAGEDSVADKHSLLQLQVGSDESSFLQVSLEVSDVAERRPNDTQHINQRGAASKNPAEDRWVEARAQAARAAPKNSFAVMQLAAQMHLSISSFLTEQGSKSALDLLSRAKSGDAVSVATIILIVIIGGALLLLLSGFCMGSDERRSTSNQPRHRTYNETMKASLKANQSAAPRASNYPGANYQQRLSAPVQVPRGGSADYEVASSSSAGHSLMMSPSPFATTGPSSNQPPRPNMASPQLKQVSSTPQLTTPEFGAIVPSNKKFVVKIPSLLEKFPSNQEIIKNFGVHTQDDVGMFTLKVLRLQDEEYLALTLMSDPDHEVAVCTFHSDDGVGLICEIYKSGSMGGSKLYGVLQEEAASPQPGSTVSQNRFVLMSADQPPSRLFTVSVAGSLSDRRVRIFDGVRTTVEIASTIPASAGIIASDACYETVCFPNSDVTLVVLVLAALDRFASISSITTI
mmetsp:Transcript_97048/g.182521  ORF Transcript_97048/g.182521 Transcript_97048/m.182521 type:complete len:483 (-) Transcript_97048:59-1507(-)